MPANVVHPGSTDTDMNQVDGDTADQQRQLIALGHYGTADDIAATVAHLAGPGGRYIGGQAITVDGGGNAGVAAAGWTMRPRETMSEPVVGA